MVRLFEDMAITSALSDYFLPLKKVKQMLESNIFALKWERTLMRFPRMEMPLPPTDLYKVIYLLRGIANWLGVARSV